MFFSMPGFFSCPTLIFKKYLSIVAKSELPTIASIGKTYHLEQSHFSDHRAALWTNHAIYLKKDEFCKDPIHHMLKRTKMKQIVANSQRLAETSRLAPCTLQIFLSCQADMYMQATVKFLNGKIYLHRRRKSCYIWKRKKNSGCMTRLNYRNFDIHIHEPKVCSAHDTVQ